ncbi:helix-turn-helix domain-containing protein [Mycoplana rhizolycopersici]|uniref:Helix-turn-helix domain-containing protein n=1 Tax=Mycoplana rhizolycopersici TaxID=2746702 RepID=A0ABX2QLS1_9HYPH|nr:helix-turn-helix domain-containing protein [Rhizobium rhizolycopersici]NVP58650.1 helix-turn-helix domain-containing protein [Rhizobium rhizolycopersici]
MSAIGNLRAVSEAYPCDENGLRALFLRQPSEIAEAGAALFFEGDPACHVFHLVSGNVRICRFLADGHRFIIGFLRAGDLIGLSFRSRYMFGAEAIDRVAFRRMSKRMFEEELQLAPEHRSQMLSHLRDEITASQDHMLLLSQKNAEERVCTFLLDRLDSDDTPGLVSLPMIRSDIADYLGMTIETVSRTLTKLVLKGIILPAARHQFKVVSRSSLARHANEANEYDDHQGEALRVLQ